MRVIFPVLLKQSSRQTSQLRIPAPPGATAWVSYQEQNKTLEPSEGPEKHLSQILSSLERTLQVLSILQELGVRTDFFTLLCLQKADQPVELIHIQIKLVNDLKETLRELEEKMFTPRGSKPCFLICRDIFHTMFGEKSKARIGFESLFGVLNLAALLAQIFFLWGSSVNSFKHAAPLRLKAAEGSLEEVHHMGATLEESDRHVVAEEIDLTFAKDGVPEPVLVFRWSFIEKLEVENLSSRELLPPTGDFIGT